MEKIIFNANHTLYQKIILIGGFFLMLNFSYKLFTNTYINMHNEEVKVSFYVAIIPLIIAIVMFLVFFSKKGIVIKNNSIFRSFFIFSKPYFPRKVDLTDITDVSVFKTQVTENIEFYRPGPANGEFSSEKLSIYLLNDQHTYKDLLIESNQKELVDFTVDYLQNEFDLKYNMYDPRF